MMRSQVLFAAWAVLTVCVSCAEVDPAELKYVEGPTTYDEEAGPVQVIESIEEIDLDKDFLALVRADTLLFRTTFQREAVANTILVQRVKYTGRESTRISSVRGAQIGTDQGAIARIIAGGVGYNTVTIEITSARGHGYDILIEILGRY